jgi:hypothetical protein
MSSSTHITGTAVLNLKPGDRIHAGEACIEILKVRKRTVKVEITTLSGKVQIDHSGSKQQAQRTPWRGTVNPKLGF